MVSEAVVLKISSVFEILLASLFGALLPFAYIRLFVKREDNHDHGGEHGSDLDAHPIFFLLKALSCGIIIGVALLHLLPDADELLGDEWSYPGTSNKYAIHSALCS